MILGMFFSQNNGIRLCLNMSHFISHEARFGHMEDHDDAGLGEQAGGDIIGGFSLEVNPHNGANWLLVSGRVYPLTLPWCNTSPNFTALFPMASPKWNWKNKTLVSKMGGWPPFQKSQQKSRQSEALKNLSKVSKKNRE